MRYAIISDIHANIEALDAVLQSIDRLSVDETVCCGDLVGYYSNPNECIDRIRSRGISTIIGNHDMAAADLKRLDSFWHVARRAITWTRRNLSEENKTFLRDLPGTLIIDKLFLLFHGALHPDENPEDLHLENDADIRQSFAALQTRFPSLHIAWFGHMHIPRVYRLTNGKMDELEGSSFQLDPESLYLINPGSVGLSRDEDARPSFALYDSVTNRIDFHRCEHSHAEAKRKAGQAGLLRPSFMLTFIRRVIRKLCKIVNCADVDY